MPYVLCAIFITASCFICYRFGVESGKHSESVKQTTIWQTRLTLQKHQFEDQLDIYRDEMLATKKQYCKLCEKHYDDAEDEFSGLVED